MQTEIEQDCKTEKYHSSLLLKRELYLDYYDECTYIIVSDLLENALMNEDDYEENFLLETVCRVYVNDDYVWIESLMSFSDFRIDLPVKRCELLNIILSKIELSKEHENYTII